MSRMCWPYAADRVRCRQRQMTGARTCHGNYPDCHHRGLRPNSVPHVKTDSALAQMQAVLGTAVLGDWVPTATLEQDCAQALAGFDGLWISPGSPYRSMRGALHAIRFGRERGLPVLGTCGGCQHMAIEFAHNVLGIEDTTGDETDPYPSKLIITPLSCPLTGKAMAVLIAPESRIAAIYGKTEVIEEYFCNFGLNPAYQSQFDAAGLRIVGTDADGETRILALAEQVIARTSKFSSFTVIALSLG